MFPLFDSDQHFEHVL